MPPAAFGLLQLALAAAPENELAVTPECVDALVDALDSALGAERLSPFLDSIVVSGFLVLGLHVLALAGAVSAHRDAPRDLAEAYIAFVLHAEVVDPTAATFRAALEELAAQAVAA
jgi:hypothetical protein